MVFHCVSVQWVNILSDIIAVWFVSVQATQETPQYVHHLQTVDQQMHLQALQHRVPGKTWKQMLCHPQVNTMFLLFLLQLHWIQLLVKLFFMKCYQNKNNLLSSPPLAVRPEALSAPYASLVAPQRPAELQESQRAGGGWGRLSLPWPAGLGRAH